jgi:hypothetical protein
MRAIAVYQGITLALTEDGLTTLDSNGTVLDFMQGGGQRLAVSGGRVYIAALKAGVRLLQVDSAGNLTPLDTLATAGAAVDIAPEASGTVWVAEGDQGIRLYDSNTRSVVTWINNLAPAQVVRLTGAHLLVGFGNNLSLLDTINPTAPQVLSTVSVDSGIVTDLAISGANVYLSRQGESGADAVLVTIEDGLRIVSQFGSTGAGERLAFKSGDLFIASTQEGLRRVRFGEGDPVLVEAWSVRATDAPCILTAPSVPQPANGSEIPQGDVTLTWLSTCSPDAYEVRINGNIAATVNKAAYTFSPDSGVIDWQIIAVDAQGNRAESPLWRFETAVEGWLATPASPPNSALLYTPPLIQVDTTSPQTVLTLTCGALLGGLAFIVLVSWMLGRRYHSEFPKL